MNSKILCILLLLLAWKLTAQTSVTLLEPANGATNTSLHPMFKWTQPAGATGYAFQISEKSDFSLLYVSTQQAPNSLPLKHTLFPSTKYFWRVRALYSTGYTGDNNNWSPVFSLTTKDTVITLSTTLVQPADNSEQNFLNPINFKWRKNDGIMYVLQLSTDKAKINNDFFVLLGSDTTYIHQQLLELNKTYYWRVCTIAPQGPWSSIFSFKMVERPQPPQPAVRMGTESAFSFPNPFKDLVTINFQLGSAGVVQFEISDSQGLKIDRFDKSFSENGRQSVEWNSKAVRPGNYFCKIVSAEKTEVVKLLLSQ